MKKLFVVVLAMGLSACASSADMKRVQADLAAVRAEAQAARQIAEEANSIAREANNRSKVTEEVVNRSFKRSMYK